MNDTNPTQIHATGEATGFIPAPGDKGKPITVIGTNSIRAGFDATCLQQALNARGAPGVTDLVLNPDAHAGYGAPVGCVLTSPTHVYPGPVGVDIKCSMSFLQLDLPGDQLADKPLRRALINAILERTPTAQVAVRDWYAKRARSASNSASKSPPIAHRPKFVTLSAFHWIGRNAAKMLHTWATMVRAMCSPHRSTVYSMKTAS